MAYSSILGADKAPVLPSGRDAEALGPSDNSDSGSDAAGTFEAHADSDAVGTGERGAVTPGTEGRAGADILPDQVVMATDEQDDRGAVGVDAEAYTDIDGNEVEGDDSE